MEDLRRWLRLLALCGTLVVLYFAVPATTHMSAWDGVSRALVMLVCLGLLAALVTRQLRLQIDQGMDRRADGLVISVVTVAIFFSMAFYLMSEQDPTQLVGLHTRIDALYFTMTTLTTIGYGDVYAAGQAARALVIVQMLFNVVFVASTAALLSQRIRTRAGERAAARKSRGE